MTREEKITHLSGLFKRAADARALAASEVWAEAWVELERTLLDELLACGPTEDEKRYRMQTAIEVGRTLRRLIEAKGAMKDQIEKELDFLTGERIRSVA